MCFCSTLVTHGSYPQIGVKTYEYKLKILVVHRTKKNCYITFYISIVIHGRKAYQVNFLTGESF